MKGSAGCLGVNHIQPPTDWRCRQHYSGNNPTVIDRNLPPISRRPSGWRSRIDTGCVRDGRLVYRSRETYNRISVYYLIHLIENSFQRLGIANVDIMKSHGFARQFFDSLQAGRFRLVYQNATKLLADESNSARSADGRTFWNTTRPVEILSHRARMAEIVNGIKSRENVLPLVDDDSTLTRLSTTTTSTFCSSNWVSVCVPT